MISIWEGVQGLLFMASFGAITRRAIGRSPAVQPAKRPQAASPAVSVPTPRSALPEERETLPIG